MTKNSTSKIYASILVTLLLLIFFHYLGWITWLEKITINLSSEVLTNFRSLTTSFREKDSAVKSECLEEYDQIIFWQKQNELSSIQLKILEQENNEFKNLLNFSRKNFSYDLLTARIMGKGTENTERVISISAGFDDGIRIGQPVVAYEGVLIGKILRVEKNISWVRLLNDGNSKIAAMILNEEKSQGVIEGGYGLSVNMNFIPRNEKVVPGEKIISSDLDSDIPKGLIIGEVAAVVNEAYQPFQKAVVNPAINFSKINIVGIMIKKEL